MSGTAGFEAAYKDLLSQKPGILASESGAELAWLGNARERDMRRVSELGLPTRRLERWKYTNTSYLSEPAIQPGATAAAVLPELSRFPKFEIEASAEIAFLNGQFIRAWSKLSGLEGVTVDVLSDLVSESQKRGWTAERLKRLEHFRAGIESSDVTQETVFAGMNTSFLQDAVVISLAPKTVLQKPIVVRYFSSASGTEKMRLTAPRTFVHAGRFSQASVVEVHSGLDEAYFSTAVTDLVVDEGAKLIHCKVQGDALTATHIGSTRVRQARDSRCETYLFASGAKTARHDLRIALQGSGAEAVLDGLYMAAEGAHVDCFTSVDHVVPHTTSSQLYKGIIADISRAVFNGRVHIYKDAQQSNAAQLNNNLVLSPKAEVDSKPELEIDADDVKASHGTTIGQIDPEHVFYLRARAISEVEAVQMLARGFGQDVVFRISDDIVRAAVGTWVDSQLDAMKVGRK